MEGQKILSPRELLAHVTEKSRGASDFRYRGSNTVIRTSLYPSLHVGDVGACMLASFFSKVDISRFSYMTHAVSNATERDILFSSNSN